MSEAKRFWMIGGAAFAALAAAAAWLGGLNQDEGWYLYAANLVAEGKTPYRDFFFTQGPVMPYVYSFLRFAWNGLGLLGGRVATCVIGLLGILAFADAARSLVPAQRRGAASAAAFLLLACNLYHVYFLTIPKTYALASLLVAVGVSLAIRAAKAGAGRVGAALFAASGFVLALASGVRVSMAAVPAAAFFVLLSEARRRRLAFFFFGAGCAVGFLTAYGPFLVDPAARAGLLAAQDYHTSRGGSSPILAIGSVSRLVRWYLPVFIFAGLALFGARGALKSESSDNSDSASLPSVRRFAMKVLVFGFLAAFLLQILAPVPYEDYQVPVMGLLAVAAVVAVLSAESVCGMRVAPGAALLLATGLSFASSFGSPLLEEWMTNGQDRFWILKKEKSELAQLRDAAALVESLDPGGATLLTQDLYLAVETGRKVPDGLEMGPFSQLTDGEWRALLDSAPCRIAALSGYTFAVDPPVCDERALDEQLAYWAILKRRYELAETVEAFGQNATTLLVLRRRGDAE